MTMRLGFVVQRYGLEIAGGAEYHCRLVAEHLSRHAQVDVLTTCARDYITWANHYPEGEETLNGVRVRRFRVERTRDDGRYSAATASVLGRIACVEPGQVDPVVVSRATEALSLAWLDEQGPLAPGLVAALRKGEGAYDALVFFSYRYWTTWHGLMAASRPSLLVPTAEDDGAYRLPIFPPLFQKARALVFNSPEERTMLEGAAAGPLPGEVVGVGSELPGHLDAEAFRRDHGLREPFLLYVGRIDRNKGCAELFDFFLRYRLETGSGLKLVLIGKAVLDVPDDPAIVSLGFLPDQAKWDALAASLALVMPSWLESLSMVTLEAFWAERPVLANARCEVLRGQCRRANAGLYYATYDEFREALAALEERPGLGRVLGRNGRAYYDAHYTWDRIEKKYLDLLAGLHASRAPLPANASAPA
ncbi:MAG TPA: glycosyltransferase family 4 protein [Vicinamibacteria bacterium]|nr:glycosyltransferase family 4 protein [Vicinamibacteria bacterium]